MNERTSERVSSVRDCMFIVWLLWIISYTEFRIYWQHIDVYTAVENAYIAIGLRFCSPFVSLELTRPVADSMNNSKVCRTLLAARHPNEIQWNKSKNINWLINQRQIKVRVFKIHLIYFCVCVYMCVYESATFVAVLVRFLFFSLSWFPLDSLDSHIENSIKFGLYHMRMCWWESVSKKTVTLRIDFVSIGDRKL